MDSFKLIKELLNAINLDDFPYLKIILVQNKIDLESNRQVSSYEIKEFLTNNNNLDNQEISLKNGENLNELLLKINEYINNTKNKLPSNIVSECSNASIFLPNSRGSLSLILLGDSAVGKTCFYTNYFKNTMSQTFVSTMGIDKAIKCVKVGNDIYRLTLWDTAGQERFRSLPKKYYSNADGVLLLFDVTNEDTFNSVSNWMKDVKETVSKNVTNGNGKGPVLFLIGNKIDLPNRVIEKKDAEKLADSLEMKYFEVCCKNNMNIPEVMYRMILECHMRVNKIEKMETCFQLSPKSLKGENKSGGGCCGDSKKTKKNK